MSDHEMPDSDARRRPAAAGDRDTVVRLEGLLVCATDAEARTVSREIAEHLALTRAEPGCRRFDVDPSPDPLVWRVSEEFSDARAFRAHQARAAASRWACATSGIERRYTVTGLDTQA